MVLSMMASWSQVGDLNLANDCPVVFEVLYQWLYSGLINGAEFGSGPASRSHEYSIYLMGRPVESS